MLFSLTPTNKMLEDKIHCCLFLMFPCFFLSMILDLLNFPVVPIKEAVLAKKLKAESRMFPEELQPNSPLALLHVQKLLLAALQSYWLPCYLLHTLNTQPFSSLQVIFALFVTSKSYWLPCCPLQSHTK